MLPLLIYLARKARSYDHCCRGKAINFTYSECVFVVLDSITQCACTVFILSGLSAPNKTFLIISQKVRFLGKIFLNTKVFMSFSTTLSHIFLILRKIQRDVIINDVGLHVMYWLFL